MYRKCTRQFGLLICCKFALLSSWLKDQQQQSKKKVQRTDWLFVTLPPDGSKHLQHAGDGL